MYAVLYTLTMCLLHATSIIQRYAIWDCTALGFRDRSMSGRLEGISILSRVTKTQRHSLPAPAY